jgi:CHASE3 domain sensor protein
MSTTHPVDAGDRRIAHVPPTGWGRVKLLPASIAVPLGMVLLVAVLLFVANEWVYRSGRVALDEVRAAEFVSGATRELHGAILDAETGQRGFLLTGEAEYLAPFEQAEKVLPAAMQKLRSAVAEDAEMRGLAQSLEAPVAAKLEELRETLRLAQANRRTEALRMVRDGEGMRLMTQLREVLVKLDATAAGRIEAVRELRVRQSIFGRVATLIMICAAFVLIVVALRMVGAQAERQLLEREQSLRRSRDLAEQVAARTAELSSLSTTLQLSAEAERSTLAKELHDELGGLLTAAKMDMAWLSGRIGENLDAAGQEKFRSLTQLLNQAMTLKRRVVENLRPSLLDHFGLAVALRSHYEEHCARVGLDFVGSLHEEPLELEHSVQLTLFRVAQESLAGIIARGDAKHVELVLEPEEGGYAMLVGDDGGAAGLLSQAMRHRIDAARGRLTQEAVTGQGNRLRTFVPRSPARSE